MATLTNTRRCGFCYSRENLLQCSGCKVMWYCSTEHQDSHRSIHEPNCLEVMEARTKLEAGRQFSGISESSQVIYPWTPAISYYTELRMRLDAKIMKIDTFDAFQEVYDHEKGLLHQNGVLHQSILHRTHLPIAFGTAKYLPSLLLRLGRDQECYDFMKWRALVSGSNEDVPSIINSNVFEPVDFMFKSPVWFQSISTVVMTLLKIMILLDLKDLQNASAPLSEAFGGRLPQEIIDSIKYVLPRTDIVARDRALMQSVDLTARIQEVTADVRRLLGYHRKDIDTFWWVIRKDSKLRRFFSSPITPPGLKPHKFRDEEILLLRWFICPWIETPGAIEIINAEMLGSGWTPGFDSLQAIHVIQRTRQIYECSLEPVEGT